MLSLNVTYLQKTSIDAKDTYTAPIFRSKPEIDVGFLHGGYWKYSAKPSNILLYGDDIVEDETQGKQTIQDDIVVAGQDFTAGLVRMGVLPRIRYLLEVSIVLLKTSIFISDWQSLDTPALRFLLMSFKFNKLVV